MKGHFAKADVAAKKFLREFRADNCGEKNVGDLIKADTFAAGDKVDVCGISKGKGYQGVIKRFGAHSLKDTHGTGPVHMPVPTVPTPPPAVYTRARSCPATWVLSR